MPAPRRATDQTDAQPLIDPGDALRGLLRERTSDTEAALAIVRRITSSLDLEVILAEAVAVAIAVARCPVGAIYLLDEAEQRLWIRATSPGFEWLVGTYSLDVGAGLTGWTALNRTAAVVNDDPHDDPRYVSVPEADLDFRAAMTVPLISATDRLVGVITLHQRAPEGFFAADALPALNPIADLTATVIERSQLYSRSRRQIELARSISDLGDPLRSPASSRVALATLAERARLLLAAQTAAIYIRAGTAWRLASSSLGDLDAPQDELANELLEPLILNEGPVGLARYHHKDLFEALAPGAYEIGTGVAAQLEAAGEVVGVLVCVGSPATLSADERELFGIVASVSAMIVQTLRLNERLATRSAELALLEALSDGTEPAGAIAARAQSLGVDLEHPHTAATFHVLEPRASSASPEQALARLRAALRSRFEGSVVELHGVELLALLPGADQGAITADLERTLEATESELGMRLIGGTSAAGSAIEAYGVAFAEARDARQIGKAIRNPDRIVAYQALGAQRHLWALARSSARDPFQDRLRVLRDHDARHGSKLLETVEGYLEEYGHRERASIRLRVHRNTLRLRLERIKELSGIDLEDTAIRFDVQTALSILRFRELQQHAEM